MKTSWTIAELGKKAGVGVETVRYYQRLGLLAVPAAASARMHRRYGADALGELRFVLRCKALGFSLKDIGVLVRLRRAPQGACDRLHERLASLHDELDAKRRTIECQLGEVSALLRSCVGGRPLQECQALVQLEMSTEDCQFGSRAQAR
ncbi:MAG TPA: MerR family transcriptional regulator [Polyangiaceae bacterium]